MHKYPAAKALLLMIAGIIIYLLMAPPVHVVIYSIIALVLLSSVVSILLRNRVFIYLAACLCVGLLIGLRSNSEQTDWPDKYSPNQPALLSGTVISVSKTSDKLIRCKVSGSLDMKDFEPMDATVLLTIFRSGRKISLAEGSRIFAPVNVSFPKRALLPTDFPEPEYLRYSEADLMATASDNELAITGRPQGPLYYRHIYRDLATAYTDLYYSEQSSGIARALLTGNKSHIPADIRLGFSRAGTAHLLAVSGLHIGVLAAAIYLLLGFVRHKYLKLFLFLGMLAIFVVATGMQASALRAGSMIALFMALRTFQRQFEALNAFAFVVIIIICIDSPIILKPGFQLSVAAVGGIFLLCGPLYQNLKSTFRSRSRIAKYLYGSLAMSMSATVLTSPIVAYYFNIFSSYWLISNLLVIPLLSLSLVYTYIGFALFAAWPWASLQFSATSDFLINLAIGINNFFNTLPGAFVEGSQSMILTIIVAISIIYLSIKTKSRAVMLIRATSCMAAIAIAAQINISGATDKDIQIIPRPDLTAAIIPADTTLFLLDDRFPAAYPKPDYALYKYMIDYPGPIIVVYTGNCGSVIADRLRALRKIRSIPISSSKQDSLLYAKLVRLTGSHKELYKINRQKFYEY